MNLKIFASSCAIMLLLASCGQNSSESSLSSSSKARVGLFIISGGYSSCDNGSPTNMDLYRKLRELYSQWNVSHSPIPSYLASCFNEKGEVFYKTSASSQIHHRHTISEFVESVRAHAKKFRHEVWFAGHSHGGWMAMKLVHDIGGDISAAPILSENVIYYTTGLRNMYGYKFQ